MKAIVSKKAPAPVGPYSQAVVVGNIVYCSGQIAINPETNHLEKGPVQVQTKRIMQNIEGVLSEVGLGFSDIVKSSIFLTSMSDFADVNEVYSSYLKPPFPARSCVEVSGLPKGVQVEIEVIAVLKEKA